MPEHDIIHNQEIRASLGDQALFPESSESATAPESKLEASYSIIAIPGSELPIQYVGLVFSRWLRSYRYGNDYLKLTDADSYYAAYHKYISEILRKPETIVRIAVLTDDHDVALGFSVSRGTILDYVHVHKDNRRLGIAKLLVPKSIDTITHLTRTGISIWVNKYSHWKFNLFA